MSTLTPTTENTWSGGHVWLGDVRKDSFIHFTTQERADQIVEAGKLLMRPPYKKFGTDAVNAVSLRWGSWVPKVQTTHMGRGVEIVGLVFKTTAVPERGYAEEVIWGRDVSLQGLKVVSLSRGAGMLRSTPERIGEDDMVVYKESDVRTAKALNVVWIVEDPTKDSEFIDIVFGTSNMQKLQDILRGDSRWAKKNPVFHTDERSARADALQRLFRLWGGDIPTWVMQAQKQSLRMASTLELLWGEPLSR